MLAVMASPSRSSDGGGGGGGGGGRRRKSAGRGSHHGQAAAGLLTSEVLVGVTEVTAEGVAEALALVGQVGQASSKVYYARCLDGLWQRPAELDNVVHA